MSAPYTWLPMHIARQRHPALTVVAAELRKKPAEVYGYICFALGACAVYFQDGIFRASGKQTPAQVFDASASWAGKASLASALIGAGLLLEVEGGLMLAGWREEQGAQAAKFERDRERKEAGRSAARASTVPVATEDAPAPVRGASAEGPKRVQGLEGEIEGEGKKEAAAAARAKPAHIGNPKAPDRSLTDDEQAVLAAWNAAASANGRPVATTLAASMRSHAKSQINAHGLEAITRTFALICAFAPLWGPGGRGWIASLGWVLKTSDIVERARAGTYGPWVPPAPRATVARAQCACCSRPSRGQVYGVELCEAHAAEAVQHEAGARAWVESRRAA